MIGIVICVIEGIIFYIAAQVIKKDYRHNLGHLASFLDEYTGKYHERIQTVSEALKN